MLLLLYCWTGLKWFLLSVATFSGIPFFTTEEGILLPLHPLAMAVLLPCCLHAIPALRCFQWDRPVVGVTVFAVTELHTYILSSHVYVAGN